MKKTIFVYDASGKMVAEYSTIVESQSAAKVSYLTTDHLGSPRILTDANGECNLKARFSSVWRRNLDCTKDARLGLYGGFGKTRIHLV